MSKTDTQGTVNLGKKVSTTGETEMFKLPMYVELKADKIYRYRRRVSAKLRKSIGKGYLYRNLGKTKADVLSKYSNVHAEVETVLAEAQASLDLERAMNEKEKAEFLAKSERDRILFLVEKHYGKEASEMLAVGQVDDNFQWALRGLSEDLHDKIPPTTEAILHSARVPDEVVTLSKVFDIYFEYKTTGDADVDKRLYNRIMANKRNLIKAWGSVKVNKVPVEALTRKDANAYRDFLLQTTKPSSVNRNISTVSASINWYAKENGLEHTSPFNGIIIKDSAHTKDDRLPLTVDEVRQVNGVMKDTLVWPLWVMMRDLGMRTAEVSGLIVGDISLQNKTVDIKANAIRRIKTDGSERTVPISDEMIELLQPLRQGKDDTDALFDSYGNNKGSGNASSAMRKHFRKVISDEKKVPYSARHTLKDALRNSGVDGDLIDGILGHTGKTSGSRYGSGYNASIMRDALLKVWN